MSLIAQPVETFNSFFDKPRKAYTEFLRNRALKECEGVLHLTREFKTRHGLTLLCGGHLRNVVEVEGDFLIAKQRAIAAESVADMRAALAYLDSIKTANFEEIESLFMALTLIHGYNVN